MNSSEQIDALARRSVQPACSATLIRLREMLDSLAVKEDECRKKADELRAVADAYREMHIRIRILCNEIENP